MIYNLPPTKQQNKPTIFAIKASKEKYLEIAIPDRTVFISGIPEPSPSADMKYPVDVAIINKIEQLITQNE